MGMFIWVHGPACLCCGAPLEWQSKALYVNGEEQPLCTQDETLRPGVAGEIHATCRSCGSHFEIGIDRGLTAGEYQAHRRAGYPRP